MEYQLKKKQIISQVEFTNLLSFNLVENKLQRNFRTIVQALMLNQAKTDNLNQDHIQVKAQHSKQIQKINATLQQMNKKMQNIQSQQKNNQIKPSLESLAKLQSHKDLEPIISKKNIQRINTQTDDTQGMKSMFDNMNQNMNNWQNKWNDQKSQLMKQIQDMKDKLDSVGFLQNELKNFRVELRLVQDQVISNGMKGDTPGTLKGLANNNSTRSIGKRESILNMISINKVSEKKMPQKSNNTIKQLTSMNKQENKQNSSLVAINEVNNQQNQQQQNSMNNQGIQKQINSLYLQLNTLKISFEQLRDLLSDNRKQIYKSNTLLTDLKDDLNRQLKTRKSETQSLQKAIKDIKMQMLNITTVNIQPVQTQEKGMRDSTKTSKGSKRQDDVDVNYKNQLNDKISRLQAMLQNLVTQSQFNRLKNDLNDQIQKLSFKLQVMQQSLQNSQKKLQDLIIQNQVNTNSQISQIKNNMNEIQQLLRNESNQNERKSNILNAKIQQLKKSLQNLRQDIQFYQSLMTQNNKNNNNKQKKSEELLNTNNNQNDKNNKSSTNIDQKGLQALKKYFSSKMHDLRTNLLGLIRDLQKKGSNKSNGQQQVIKLWDRLNEMNLFMNKKADQDDTKKTFLYLQKKLNRLNSVLFKNQDNTQDARIARSNNWHCLSCDKNLQTYQGKIGKHVVWDSMPLKGINKSFINQVDDKKKGLPQLKK